MASHVLPGTHAPLWSLDSRPEAYAPLAGELEVDVVVVGGGITGLTTALLCKESGRSVALLEADRVASGTTGGTTGKVTSQHDLFYARAIAELGGTAARQYADANQAAIPTIRALAARHGIDPYASELPSYLYSRDPARVGELRAEAEAARSLGLPASFETDVGLPFEVAGAVRFDGQLQLHPVRLVRGYARAVHGGGSSVHEHSRVQRVSEEGDTVVLSTSDGIVRARHAVVATLLPITDRGLEFARTRPVRSYGIAARLDADPPEPMYLSVDSPTRSLRHYRGDDGDYLVVVGQSHETGHGQDLSHHYRALVDYAQEHFPVRSVTHRWSAQDHVPLDGVPYVGRLRFTRRVHVATGFKKWGMTNGTAAARIIHDSIEGIDNPWAQVFDSQRFDPLANGLELLKDNAHVARRLLVDHVLLPGRLGADGLQPGQGVVVRDGVHPVAVSMDTAGRTHAVDAVCSHLGCVVHWNDAETSWDCPCHGSRFDPDGEVLTGPATRGLGRRDTPHRLA